jgi:hypothetical protein
MPTKTSVKRTLYLEYCRLNEALTPIAQWWAGIVARFVKRRLSKGLCSLTERAGPHLDAMHRRQTRHLWPGLTGTHVFRSGLTEISRESVRAQDIIA